MKLEKWLTCLVGAVLAFLISWSGLGCMATGLSLNADILPLALSCGAWAGVSALCFRWKRGGTVLLCGLALLSGFLWQDGRVLEQMFNLIRILSRVYHLAYGWGIFPLGRDRGPVELALMLLGGLVALAVSWTVCRRLPAWLAVVAALIPLGLCLVVTNTVPKEGYLYLLLLGLALLILTNSLRRKSPEQGNLLTAILIVPVAAALGLLFWLNPQESYVNRSEEWQQQVLNWFSQDIPELWEDLTENPPVDLGSDREERVNLQNVGPRNPGNYEVMRVTSTRGGVIYLRGQDYDYYTGTGWTATSRDLEYFPAATTRLEEAGTVTVETYRVRDVRYLPYYPMEPVELLAGKTVESENATWFRYTLGTLVAPETDTLTPAQLRADQEAKGRYLSLPEQTRREAETMVAPLISGSMTRGEKAQAIASFVRGSALYDLNTARMPQGETDFALWFLNESDTGYCVHFATATAVLLRAAEIPARYVTGYMVPAHPGETVSVRANRAHAWVEYYDPAAEAWIVLESTPADLSQEPATDPVTEPSEPQETEPPAETTDPAQTNPTETTAPTQPEETTPEQPERKSIPRWVWTMLWGTLGIGGLVLTVKGQRRLRLRRKQKSWEMGPANSRALALWRESVLRSRILNRRPPKELEKLAQKAKFSQHTLSEEELAQFSAFLAESKEKLREKPWYHQAVLQYWYAIY